MKFQIATAAVILAFLTPSLMNGHPVDITSPSNLVTTTIDANINDTSIHSYHPITHHIPPTNNDTADNIDPFIHSYHPITHHIPPTNNDTTTIHDDLEEPHQNASTPLRPRNAWHKTRLVIYVYAGRWHLDYIDPWDAGYYDEKGWPLAQKIDAACPKARMGGWDYKNSRGVKNAEDVGWHAKFWADVAQDRCVIPAIGHALGLKRDEFEIVYNP